MAHKRVQEDHGLHDMYDYYVAQTGNPYNLSRKRYAEVVKKFCTAIVHTVTHDNTEFPVPGRLGYISIRKKKIRYRLDSDGKLDKRCLRVDWVATRQLWAKDDKARCERKYIYFLNEHTDGYNLHWHWDKITCNVTNVSAYVLKMARYANRMLARAAKDESVAADYYC